MTSDFDYTGRVIVRIVVEKDGSVTHPVIVHSNEPITDKEALRVMEIMPRWIPGMHKGKPVRCRYTIPVTFRRPD